MFQFEEFFDSDIPTYAILSHRWEGKEISFQELQDSKDKSGAGFSKIRNFCSLARSEGFKWCWIDTCCIDKKSSAELSEAISSMFRWYANAQACYAYLPDVVWIKDKTGVLRWSRDRFEQSAWFTRGWTLQELLAPETVIFYDSRWQYIGTKGLLMEEISAVTGIPGMCLYEPSDARRASVAMKMSWASSRETSRQEDIAYCLMGLFNINMPLLYGEGGKAFLRLQLEIIKQSDDESIFAWTSPSNITGLLSGLLATQPSSFAESGDIRPKVYSDRPPYSMTQKGLAIHVPVTANRDQLKFTLNCCTGSDLPITVDLRKSRDTWYRYDYMSIWFGQADSERKKQVQTLAYVPQLDDD